MKIITYYLPQFHEIEENNKWWGKGFTEWTNIKNSKKLYSKHVQPKKPLNKNYYNLLNKEIVEWQTNLAIKYGIYGFCYYHYWFNGRKILEKPAENLLNWKDINQKFCFCWANHSWRKTWNGTNQILLEQLYGNEKEWEDHFNYLLKFFKDPRYIKIDNKPLLMLFRSKEIPRLDERIKFYTEESKKNGFAGIFIIESLNLKKEYKKSKFSSAVVLREPNIGIVSSNYFLRFMYKIKRMFKKNYLKKPMIFNFNNITENSLNYARKYVNKLKNNEVIFLGSFTSWDNTPRHERRGFVIENGTPEKFKTYLLKQKKLMKENKIEYMFLNAWNEWAEGMYLEPDEEYKYGYLEAIKEVIDTEI